MVLPEEQKTLVFGECEKRDGGTRCVSMLGD